jgi:hypothetical protein
MKSLVCKSKILAVTGAIVLGKLLTSGYLKNRGNIFPPSINTIHQLTRRHAQEFCNISCKISCHRFLSVLTIIFE